MATAVTAETSHIIPWLILASRRTGSLSRDACVFKKESTSFRLIWKLQSR